MSLIGKNTLAASVTQAWAGWILLLKHYWKKKQWRLIRSTLGASKASLNVCGSCCESAVIFSYEISDLINKLFLGLPKKIKVPKSAEESGQPSTSTSKEQSAGAGSQAGTVDFAWLNTITDQEINNICDAMGLPWNWYFCFTQALKNTCNSQHISSHKQVNRSKNVLGRGVIGIVWNWRKFTI